MIHREGIASIVLTLLVAGLLVFLARYFCPDYAIVHYLAYAIAAFILVIVLQFFRNPKRNTTLNDAFAIAPCDGTVLVIEETVETEYFKDKRIQVSIFHVATQRAREQKSNKRHRKIREIPSR